MSRPTSVNFRQHCRNLSHETVPLNYEVFWCIRRCSTIPVPIGHTSTIHHRVYRVTESPGRSSELAPPPPPLQASVSPPGSKRWGTHSLVGRGWGEPMQTKGQTLWTLWYSVQCTQIPSLWPQTIHVEWIVKKWPLFAYVQWWWYLQTTCRGWVQAHPCSLFLPPPLELRLRCPFQSKTSEIYPPVSCTRDYSPSFRENKTKTLVYKDWKRAFWACNRKNWVYKLGHCTLAYCPSLLLAGVYFKLIWCDVFHIIVVYNSTPDLVLRDSLVT